MLLISIALATFFLTTVFRFLMPFVIPDRAAILVVGAAAYGVSLLTPHVMVILAAGGLTVLLMLAYLRFGGQIPDAWALPVWRWSRTRKVKPYAVPAGKSSLGNRVPRL